MIQRTSCHDGAVTMPAVRLPMPRPQASRFSTYTTHSEARVERSALNVGGAPSVCHAGNLRVQTREFNVTWLRYNEALRQIRHKTKQQGSSRLGGRQEFYI